VLTCVLGFIHTESQAQEAPKRSKWIKEVGFSLAHNSNVVIGTETRAKLDPVEDNIQNLNLRFGFYRALADKGFLVALYEFDLVDHAQTRILRSRNHGLQLALERPLETNRALQLGGDVTYYGFHNLKEVSFYHTNVTVQLETFTRSGLIYELALTFSSRNFPSGTSNVVGYSLVNSQRLEGSARLKYWYTPWMRWGLRSTVNREAYDKTRSTYLLAVSGLSRDDHRIDLTPSLQPEILLVPFQKLALTLGYQFQYNDSNSDYYRFLGHTLIARMVIRLNERALLFGEGTYGVFDYFKRRFDDRYLNTKEDFRRSLALDYRYELTEYLQVEAQYTYFANDSNDSLDYNPLTTKTYSTFSQAVFNLSFKIDLTDVDLF